MQTLLTLATALTLVVLGLLALARFAALSRARDRFYADDDPAGPAVAARPAAAPGGLRAWLVRAGLKHPAAPTIFLTATAACSAVGVAGLVIWELSGIERQLIDGLASIPGGTGDMFFPFVVLAPWLVLTGCALLPILYVRRQRRRRVEAIEQDLPIALDLMATLGESGLGFDATLIRLSETRLRHRPLAAEFRSFQADLLAGRSRIESLRRLSARVAVGSVTIFVSALAQAEQLGMSLADVLRRQADELRGRRRERAHAFANTLPVKLMFPLVICFLPGLFVWTLGPVFIQLFQIADRFLQARSL
ncbi:MAG TPA: type II secretion system F family protein [Planctomycetaceae bacterium]|nr:type II secretion system F family protein [Planctomycetaceae bacterium]